MGLVAALAAGLAVALLLPPARPVPSWTPPRVWKLSAAGAFASVTLVAAVLLAYAEGSALALGLILLAGATAAGRLAGLARRRRAAAVQEDRVVQLCESLTGELRSGQPPARALAHSASVWPELEPVVGAARLGAEVPEALRRLAERPGAGGLRAVAAAWQMSASSGASLTAALGQVADTAREAQAVRRVVASELAAALATARLVALLPVVALTVSDGVGGEAWRFLLTEPAGLACLAAGMALTCAGLWWIERLASGVSGR